MVAVTEKEKEAVTSFWENPHLPDSITLGIPIGVTVVKVEHSPDTGPVGTVVTFTAEPYGIDQFSDQTTINLSGKFVLDGGSSETSQTTMSFPADKVYFTSAEQDEVKIVVGEVMPNAAFLEANPRIRQANSVTMVGTATLTSEDAQLTGPFNFHIVPTVSLGEIIEGQYNAISSIDLRDQNRYELLAQVLVKEQELATPPQTLIVKIQSVDALKNDVTSPPPRHAKPYKLLVAYKLANTTVPGFVEYRTAENEKVAPWAGTIPADISPDSVPWVYVVDGGAIRVEVAR